MTGTGNEDGGARAHILGPAYTQEEVDALTSDVVPRYLSFFNAMAVERLILAPQSAVLTCGPLASSVTDAIEERLPNTRLHGFEASEAAVRAASDRTATAPGALDFEVLRSLPLELADASFTHAVVVHPITTATTRMQLLREVSRVLVPGGQLLFALPLRGSYPELVDMLREFSLKHDDPRFGEAIEVGAQSRPTPETLTEDLERLGFVDVAVDVELLSVPFETGRDFAQSSLFRLVVLPELGSVIEGRTEALGAAVDYAKLAIGKYWSEGQFDLTVNLGCASARKP